MASKSFSTEIDGTENLKYQAFRTLEAINSDEVSLIEERIRSWMQPTTSNQCVHFGLREHKNNLEGLKSVKAALGSLASSSRKLNSIWTPIALQDVKLWTYQIPSFLRLLLAHPEFGSHIRNLTFMTQDIKLELVEGRKIARELASIGHQKIAKLDQIAEVKPKTGSSLDSFLIHQTVGIARALIIEKCFNLKELKFSTFTYFPINLSQQLQLVFPESLVTLKIDDYHWGSRKKTDLVSGRQVLFMLVSLPKLKSASLVFGIDREDASVINSHVPSLVQTGKASLNLENLFLKAYQVCPKKASQLFDYTSTFENLFSIFTLLKNFTFAFVESPDLLSSNELMMGMIDKGPLIQMLDGLHRSQASLTSLSIEGQASRTQDQKALEALRRTISIIKRFQNLEHLRVDGNVIAALFMATGEARRSGSTPLLDLTSFECADNYDGDGCAEALMIPIINMGGLSKKLITLRTPKEPTPSLNRHFPQGVDRQNFDEFRAKVERAMNTFGIKLEFV